MRTEPINENFKFKPALIDHQLIVPNLLSLLEEIQKLFLKMEGDLKKIKDNSDFSNDFSFKFQKTIHGKNKRRTS